MACDRTHMFWRLRVGRAAVVGQRRRREAQAGRLAVAHGPVGQRGRRLAVVCGRQVARGRRAAERAESAGRTILPIYLEHSATQIHLLFLLNTTLRRGPRPLKRPPKGAETRNCVFAIVRVPILISQKQRAEHAEHTSLRCLRAHVHAVAASATSAAQPCAQ